MQFDFAAILVALTFFTGIVWGLDRLFFAKRRAQSVPASEIVREPLLVEYSRLVLPGDSHCPVVPLLHCGAVPHSFRLDDAHPAGWGFHSGEQSSPTACVCPCSTASSCRSASRSGATCSFSAIPGLPAKDATSAASGLRGALRAP